MTPRPHCTYERPSIDQARLERVLTLLQANDREAAWREIEAIQEESRQVVAKVLFERTKPLP